MKPSVAGQGKGSQLWLLSSGDPELMQRRRVISGRERAAITSQPGQTAELASQHASVHGRQLRQQRLEFRIRKDLLFVCDANQLRRRLGGRLAEESRGPLDIRAGEFLTFRRGELGISLYEGHATGQ